MSLDKLKKTLEQLKDGGVKTQTVWVKVTDINWEEKTMDAMGIVDELPYLDILLGIGSLDIKPVVGSYCIIGIIDNNDTTPFLIMANEVDEIQLSSASGLNIRVSEDGITIEARDKPIKINGNNSSIAITENGLSIISDKQISLNGGFEALYNKVPGMPIVDVSQIGISKKVKLG